MRGAEWPGVARQGRQCGERAWYVVAATAATQQPQHAGEGKSAVQVNLLLLCRLRKAVNTISPPVYLQKHQQKRHLNMREVASSASCDRKDHIQIRSRASSHSGLENEVLHSPAGCGPGSYGSNKWQRGGDARLGRRALRKEVESDEPIFLEHCGKMVRPRKSVVFLASPLHGTTQVIKCSHIVS